MTLIDRAREWARFAEEHPGEGWSGGDLDALLLGRFAVAVAEALPGLYLGEVDEQWAPRIAARNAALDELAKMLEGE